MPARIPFVQLGKGALRPLSPATTISRAVARFAAPAPPRRILAAPLTPAVRHEAGFDGAEGHRPDGRLKKGTAEMTMKLIHWSNLVASPQNVRKHKTGIESLAASIAADGLIHNLVVTEREDGKSPVIAGERRRRAIIQLVRAGTWPRDTHIPCEVRDNEDATAVSYAENAQRVAMHPADAIRAFATLAAEGKDEAAIAHRYGYDPREVRRMLALASLSKRILNALAADKIDLATAQAFTITDDHKRQEKVLRVARTAHEVRRRLTETKVTTGHRLFRFVGTDAYLEAGGGITRDLFVKDDEGYADDPALVQQLADAKFQREVMERPFFSLQKRKRLKPIEYSSPDGEAWDKWKRCRRTAWRPSGTPISLFGRRPSSIE